WGPATAHAAAKQNRSASGRRLSFFPVSFLGPRDRARGSKTKSLCLRPKALLLPRILPAAPPPRAQQQNNIALRLRANFRANLYSIPHDDSARARRGRALDRSPRIDRRNRKGVALARGRR